jgi:hypothetical protein
MKKDEDGQMAEWLMAADCKSAALTCYGGSNPSLPTISREERAHVAQLVEHVLGKDGVSSSNLLVGSSFSAPISLLGGSNSGVESQPSKLLVAGSNPVSRSIHAACSTATRNDVQGCSSNWLERRSPKP